MEWDDEAINRWRDCPPPGAEREHESPRCGASRRDRNPPIRSLYVFGANPAASSPNAGRIVEGLRRPGLFTVVHELFLTDTADYADIVLPATSQLEQTDLHKAYGTSLLTYNPRRSRRCGECKSNWEVMGMLAAALGLQEPWLHQSADEVIEELLSATAEKGTRRCDGITLTSASRRRDAHPSRMPRLFPTGVSRRPAARSSCIRNRSPIGASTLPRSFPQDEEADDTDMRYRE